MTERGLFTYFLTTGAGCLVIGVLNAFFGANPGFAITFALAGIGFMVGAVALAVYDQRAR